MDRKEAIKYAIKTADGDKPGGISLPDWLCAFERGLAEAGYAVVPLEPTEEMVITARETWRERVRQKIAGEIPWDSRNGLIENYRAMIAAARK